MRKLTIVGLITVFLIICVFSLIKDDSFEVLKVVSATDFYVDFNRNKVAEENELLQLFELDLEPDALSKIEQTYLQYLSKKFAMQNLFHKRVKVVSALNKEARVLLPDGNDYAKILIQRGYVFDETNKDKVEENLKYAKSLNLVSYNTFSGKYHKLHCKYAFKSRNEEILKEKDLPSNAKPCKFCHLYHVEKKKSKVNRYNKYPRDVDEPYNPVYKDNLLEFYVTDFTKQFYPSKKCVTTACKSLLKEIKSAKSSIDFAVYGFDSQPAIVNALVEAQKRGVKVRWVYDTDKNGTTIYRETLAVKNILTDARADIDCVLPVSYTKSLRDSIMHNKFFIFDNQKVWTGSANITQTDLSGFNANTAVLINSKTVAQIYKTEFEQMYFGKFHQLKQKSLASKTILGSSKISVYFSPQDRIITNSVIPIINGAKKYVYVPVFVITHKDFQQALVNAVKRGADVRVIVDATSAGAKYSGVKFLRENNIKVKTENRAGKMHMKSIIVDDRYTVLGSMNFTKSGENYNDENVLVIENPALTKAFKQKFLYFYETIPDKWLWKNPSAESWSSINSCFDGVDNDFDGKIDNLDEGCRPKHKTVKK